MLYRLMFVLGLLALAACNPKVRPEGVLPKDDLPAPPSEPAAARRAKPAEPAAPVGEPVQKLQVPRS